MRKRRSNDDGEPQSIGELMPEALRRIWNRGRAHREATWKPKEIAHVEALLSDYLPPRKDAA